MDLIEKAAYLKGLRDGLKLGEEDDVVRLLSAVVDTIGDLAKAVDGLNEHNEVVSDELDMIEDDLDEICSPIPRLIEIPKTFSRNSLNTI